MSRPDAKCGATQIIAVRNCERPAGHTGDHEGGGRQFAASQPTPAAAPLTDWESVAHGMRGALQAAFAGAGRKDAKARAEEALADMIRVLGSPATTPPEKIEWAERELAAICACGDQCDETGARCVNCVVALEPSSIPWPPENADPLREALVAEVEFSIRNRVHPAWQWAGETLQEYLVRTVIADLKAPLPDRTIRPEHQDLLRSLIVIIESYGLSELSDRERADVEKARALASEGKS